MERVGRLLNLKKHTVGKERVPLIGPGDIEGHLGTDGRYYLLDYARLMPPEAPRTLYVSASIIFVWRDTCSSRIIGCSPDLARNALTEASSIRCSARRW